jgi:hypothetical protein
VVDAQKCCARNPRYQARSHCGSDTLRPHSCVHRRHVPTTTSRRRIPWRSGSLSLAAPTNLCRCAPSLTSGCRPKAGWRPEWRRPPKCQSLTTIAAATSPGIAVIANIVAAVGAVAPTAVATAVAKATAPAAAPTTTAVGAVAPTAVATALAKATAPAAAATATAVVSRVIVGAVVVVIIFRVRRCMLATTTAPRPNGA